MITFNVTWKRKNGNFHHAVSFSEGANSLFDSNSSTRLFRSGGRPILVLAPGNRVKAWGSGLTSIGMTINEVDITGKFVEGNNGLYQAHLTAEEFNGILTSPASTGSQMTSPPETPEQREYVNCLQKNTEFTPVELANMSWRDEIPVYQAWRRDSSVNFSPERRQQYFLLRGWRNYVTRWRNSVKSSLIDDIEDSLDSASIFIEKHETFLDWFEGQSPTEEDFTGRNGIDDVDSTGSYSGDGYTATFSWRQRYDNEVRMHTRLYNKIRNKVDAIKARVSNFVDIGEDDTVLDSVITEILSVGSELGLMPHESWNRRNDGVVWFTHSQTQKNYFFSLSSLRGYNYTHSIQKTFKLSYYVQRNGIQTALRNQFADLRWSTIGTEYAYFSDPTRILWDIGTAFKKDTYGVIPNGVWPGEKSNPFRTE